MKWENLTWNELEDACEATDGVCVVPIGCLEAHAAHLPLGTDFILAHKIAAEAAKIEQAVVFPALYFGSVYENADFCGAICLDPELLIRLYFNVFDEISRNRFKKIIILNGHGGNDSLLRFLAHAALSKKRNYNLYFINGHNFSEEQSKQIEADCEGRPVGHACENETSIMLHIAPELVQPDKIPKEQVDITKRRGELDEIGYDSLWWRSQWPKCYIGDASYATKERGEKYVGFSVENLIKMIRAVKEDKVVAEISEEFYRKSNL